VAALATLAYAALILGFGLVYRPLGNDEGVTYDVASQSSVFDVLDTAVNERHGPPLHYLLIHFSLLWRNDMLGMRLPSALLGILAVALSYGLGRELLGRWGGALVAVIVAANPMTVHLAQFSRGYTALVAAAFGSLWLLLVLVRTRRARYVAPYAVAALLLVAAHPFGLFALASELVIGAVLGLWPLRRELRRAWPMLLALALGTAALVALWAAYRPLSDKYRVGSGGPVIDVADGRFWDELGRALTGSWQTAIQVAAAAVVAAGVAVLARRDRRAAFVVSVWLLLPLAALSVLTPNSPDFAPERHLSFLLPGYAVAVAAAVLAVARWLDHGRRAALAGSAALLLFLTPAALADYDDISDFPDDLRQAALWLTPRFGAADVLATTAGRPLEGVDPRLYGTYVVLAADDDSALGRVQPLGSARGCDLVERLSERPAPDRVWVIVRPLDPERSAALMRAAGAEVMPFDEFLVASVALREQSVGTALRRAASVLNAAVTDSAAERDIRRAAEVQLIALTRLNRGRCVAA
jgi:mannosyltransferase